jgi:hypothetical protein
MGTKRTTTLEHTRICGRCKAEKPHAAFKKGYQRNVFFPYCHDCTKAVARETYRRQRERILKAYGGACACCGETEPAFLAVDHKDGGGKQHVKALGGATAFYRWLVAESFPSGFQLLCHNCNHGRHNNGGVCPHQEKGAHYAIVG